MLRITPVNDDGPMRVIKLEGKLIGPWVEELTQACLQNISPESELHLDLSSVTYIDGAGVKLLRGLLTQGIGLTSCSSLVTELLQRESR